jgi:hypothetical protein
LAKYDADFRANFYFTTNHEDPLNIDSDDRRWWVIGCPNWGTPKEREVFFIRFGQWLFVNGKEGPLRREAMEALLYHFIHEVDCTAFNEKARAPASAAKERMAELSENDAETFVRALKDDPHGTLGHDYRWAVTFEIIFRTYIRTMRGDSIREGDHKKLRAALLYRGFECKVFASKNKKAEQRKGVRLVIIEAAWRKDKKDSEIYNYHTNFTLLGWEKAPYNGTGSQPKICAYNGSQSGKVTNLNTRR